MSSILVIGDSCIDEYVYCSTDRFCPDAPVPVLNTIETVKSLGMAGNVSDNLKSLGEEVSFLTNKQSVTKTRYVDKRTNHMFIRIDQGEDLIKPVDRSRLESVIWDQFDAIVISDYNKGFLDEPTIKYISEQHEVTFLDTKKPLGDWASKIKFIKINNIELDQSIGYLHDNEKVYKEKIVTTLGSKGAHYMGETYDVQEVDVRDTSGAGDTFLAGLVHKFVSTKSITGSIRFANYCATQVVQKKGTAKIKLPL
jgi:D-beta-D-heptose 7-phosphate kinase/D-beta-D-heptose 1-phosphate adenosyltransferase